jgi:2-methylisocitrate lyase-like PEP mutase family enzyme
LPFKRTPFYPAGRASLVEHLASHSPHKEETMATLAQLRKSLATQLAAPEIVMAPGAVDPLTARVVEAAGFPAIHASGSMAHRTSGYADAGILTMNEMVDKIMAMADAVDIPIIGDGDTGFGNVVNVVRTIKNYERAGACAIHLEDQVTPKRPTHQGMEAGVISVTEMVNKIKAALDARTDENFVIIARCEVKGEPQEIIDRLARYLEEGADAAWISGGSEEPVRALRKAAGRKPLIGVLPRGTTPQQFQDWGASGAVVPGALEVAAVHAQRELLEELKRGVPPSEFFARVKDIEKDQQFFNRQGNKELEAINERFGAI